MAAIVVDADNWRGAHGIAPLKGESDEIPEKGLNDRARRVGLLKRGD
jgi:hypothetical protein